MIRFSTRSILLLLWLLPAGPAIASANRAPELQATIGADLALRPADLQPTQDYDPSVPVPAELLGFEVGAWHVNPDQQLRYLAALASRSPRVALDVQGYSHERRAQPLLTITSPANHARLEEIRTAHLDRLASGEPAPDDAPVIVLLGFSIHGNEPSGANASLLVAHHLAAARGGEVEQWLDNAVVLLDPSFNPDGIARFAHWANTNRGLATVSDPQNREHNEAWPPGRTNHYLFDLNRDWLLAQHPESRNRLSTFHRWRPNLLTDHHEMGSNSTFFFQPGVAQRTNPLIPESNVELTHRLAEFHADALDAAGRLYYSEEGFDDFYPGKGSTYPDLHGAVGILFEQASARGHRRRTRNGELTFPFAISNQYHTALSSVRGAVALRREFLAHQIQFAAAARQRAAEGTDAGYLIHVDRDAGRFAHLVDFFAQHRIESRTLSRDVERRSEDSASRLESFAADTSLFVPLDQMQSTLVRSIFEPLTEFEDDVFYDVSTWSMPMAFNAVAAKVLRSELAGLPLAASPSAEQTDSTSEETGTEPVLAYAFDWHHYYAPRALARLQRAGAKARVAVQSMTLSTTDGEVSFPRGTVLIPAAINGGLPITELAAEIERADGIRMQRIVRGLASVGVDLGSPSLRPVKAPRVAILSGNGTRSYDVGEAWHLLDYRFQMPTTLLEIDSLGSVDLDDYTHLVFADGRYGLDEVASGRISRWLRAGGTVIGTEGGAHYLAQLVEPESPQDREGSSSDAPEAPGILPYDDYRRARAAQLLGGTIVAARFDLTHPLTYGYSRDVIPLFRTSTDLLAKRVNPYETVGRYQDPPRLSGYSSPENQRRLAGQPALQAFRHGRGLVVQLADNPNFRAFWFGTSKLFLNAIFLSDLVDRTSSPATWAQE